MQISEDNAAPMSASSFESICYPIRTELEEIEKTLHTLVYSPVEMVTQVASHIVHSGGKRLRPILCILTSRLFDCQLQKAIQLACVFEFIHTATLLHDDVIDHASLRRGRVSSNSLWGDKASVLVGDYLYCKASSIIATVGDLEVLGIVAQVTAETTEGEVLEIVKSNNTALSEESYLEIIKYKTACLIAAAAQVGALSGRASKEDQERVRQFGYCLGMAFQLADDALDYISSDEEIGKEVGTDLKEGKLTLPLIYTLRSCNSAQRSRIQHVLENPKALQDELKEILAIINEYRGIQYTLDKAREFIQQAKDLLSVYPDSPFKQSLLLLADYMIQRKK